MNAHYDMPARFSMPEMHQRVIRRELEAMAAGRPGKSRRWSRRGMFLGTTIGLVAAGGGVAAAYTVTNSASGPLTPSQAARAPWADGTILPAHPSSSSMSSRDQAIQRLLGSEHLDNVSRTDAVETTWATYISAQGQVVLSPGLQVRGDDAVWVAAASGQGSIGVDEQPVSWTAVVYDAATGMPLGSASGQGSWPTWFDKLSS